MNGTQRNPDDGGQCNDPADTLSPGREDVVPIASRFELNDGENQNNLAKRDTRKRRNSVSGESVIFSLSFHLSLF